LDPTGSDTVSDTAGNEIFDFRVATDDLTFALVPDDLTVTNGGARVDVDGAVIENLLGGLGSDTLDLSGYNAGRKITLNAAGTLNGFRGSVDTANPVTFDNINNLIGSSTPADHLIGPDTGATFQITGSEAGNVNNLIAFSGIENLDGGPAIDILDYCQFTGDSQVTLIAAGTVDGFKGTATGLSGEFDNFNTYQGRADGDDTLIGHDNGATFNITANSQGNVDGFFTFRDINNLTGGAGVDTLDYSLSPNGVIVDLSVQKADGLSGTVNSIENITGSPHDDTLTGDAGANIITDNGGTDILSGGDGNDRFVLNPGWGSNDTILDSSGNDLLALDGIDFPLTVSLDTGSFTVSGDGNSVSHTGDAIENIIAGKADDIFKVNDQATINLDGSAGTNSLDYSGHDGPVAIDLSTSTATGLVGSTFENINDFTGSANVDDRLLGFDAATNFNITGDNTGNINDVYTFSAIENLTGLGNDDTFALIGSGSLSGEIDGGVGADTLNYTAYTAGPVVVDLDTVSATGLNAFSQIETITGSSQSDTILASSAGSTFVLTNLDAGTADGINFGAFENIIGVAGSDNFEIKTGAALSGRLDGGDGDNKLDFSTHASGQTVTLITIGTGTIDGFAGKVEGVLPAFDRIDNIIGNSSVGEKDTLVGIDANATWNLGTSQYASTHTLEFDKFEILVGGSAEDQFDLPGAHTYQLSGGAGADSFKFYDPTALSGSIDGGADMDTLDYSQVSIDVDVNLALGFATGVNAGAKDSVRNVENFRGGTGSNTITGDPGDNKYYFFDHWGVTTVDESPASGGGGNDTIDFSGVTEVGSGHLTFTFDGGNFKVEDALTGSVVHADTAIENFIGGPTDDRFIFKNDAVVAGLIDGGLGDDTLDYSEYGSPRDFVLTGHGSLDGYKGTVVGLGGFDNINALAGTNLPQPDSLTGMAADATWKINVADDQYTTDVTHSLNFVEIETLVGGSAADNFALEDTATHLGTINGGSGMDVLNYSDYTSSICANLSSQSHTATVASTDVTCLAEATTAVNGAAAGAISGIENLAGGSEADLLVGDALANEITGNAGNDELYGNSGDDTYIYDDLWGVDNIYENAAGGLDTIDLKEVDANLSVVLGSVHIDDNALGDSIDHAENHLEVIRSGRGNDTFTITGEYSLSLYGGPGDDTFDFADGAVLRGLADGQSGQDTISMDQLQTPLTATLTQPGAENGMDGSVTAEIAGVTTKLAEFVNTDQIIGSQQEDTLVGSDAAAIWELDGSDRYIDKVSGQSIGFTDFEILQGGISDDFFDVLVDRTYNIFGGEGDDTFSIANFVHLKGSVDGGSGQNTLDFTRYDIPVNFRLTDIGSVIGFKGTDSERRISAGFDNITTLVGGQGADSLSSLNVPSVSHITGSGDYNALQRKLYFDSIENLNGSAFDDEFIFKDGATLDGYIDGRGGTDLVDFSDYKAGIYVNLTNDIVRTRLDSNPIIRGGLTSIENLRGGSGDDVMIGDEKQNVFDGGPGNDNLIGGLGDDTFYGGQGIDIVDGGPGNDTLYVPPESTYIAISIENLGIISPPVLIPPSPTSPRLIFREYSKKDIPILPVTEVIVRIIIPVTSGLLENLNQNQITILVLYRDDGSEIEPSDELSVSDRDLTVLPAATADQGCLVEVSEMEIPEFPIQLGEFVSSMTVITIKNEIVINELPKFAPIIVSFVVPLDYIGRELLILYWDPTLNAGLGGWVELEVYLMEWDSSLNAGLGGWSNAPSWAFDLLPAPQIAETRVATVVNFTGTFVLISKP